jgi:hypothetical protein
MCSWIGFSIIVMVLCVYFNISQVEFLKRVIQFGHVVFAYQNW